MQSTPQKWLITGANGNLGRRLTACLMAAGHRVVAVVRSESARESLMGLDPRGPSDLFQVQIANYDDAAQLADVADDCDRVIHLVGILKASSRASYTDAHERSCERLLQALVRTQVRHVTYVSILGSTPTSGNPCLASKGRAEKILADGQIPCCTLRVPMVVGEGDYASAMLQKRAHNPRNFAFRASSLEQPIYAGDVVSAICAAASQKLEGGFDLAGPESLTRAALYERAATVVGRKTKVISLPVGLGLALAFVLEKTVTEPPITRAMLEVLDHDDDVDTTAIAERLEITPLTTVDEMLRLILPG